jgi:hypothetical protein
MRCSSVREKLGSYLDGELPERKAKRVQKHLAECSACAWELRSFQKVDELGKWAVESAPEGYWEGYLARLHSRMEREEREQKLGMPRAFGRRLRFLAGCWLRKASPGLAAVLVTAALIAGYTRFSPTRIGKPEIEKITVNFYLKQHENAIMQASYSTEPPQSGIELGYEDVFYYDAARGPDREWPGEMGIFLRAPRRSVHPERRKPSHANDISNGHSLSLKKAQESVSFEVIAPHILHPGYFLENIRKIEGKECLQLIYTNGMSALSLFEQAFRSEERFHSSDFREYVMYSRGNGEPVNIIGWNSAEVSFNLIGEQDLSHLMGIIRAIKESYLAKDRELANP